MVQLLGGVSAGSAKKVRIRRTIEDYVPIAMTLSTSMALLEYAT